MTAGNSAWRENAEVRRDVGEQSPNGAGKKSTKSVVATSRGKCDAEQASCE